MSIADQLEAHLRDRVARNLDQSRIVLRELIIAPLNQISGQLAAGVLVDAWSENGTTYTSTARSLAPYSIYVDQGTGIYGPRGDRIYPTNAKALTFYWTGRGAWFSFKSVRGMQPQHFFSQPLPDYFAQALTVSWGP